MLATGPRTREPRAKAEPVQGCDRCAIYYFQDTYEEDLNMKYLLTGVAVVAALSFSAPAWAQPASPSGGNAMGMPGPNPGGPGLTPYRTGPAPAPTAPPPQYQGSPPPSSYPSTSAKPPKHHYAHHPSHGKMAGHYYHHGKGPQLAGSTANQLNQEELARLQAGNYSNPAAPPAPGAPPPPRQPYPMGTTGGGAPYRP